MKQISVETRDGQSIAVRVLGQGPPCVLLHGFAMESRHWLPFAWALRRRVRFILPDMRGFGGSHHVDIAQPCALSRYADDLEDILEHLDLDAVSLGGISMGAFISLKYGEQHGFGRITRYLHIDQAPRVLNGDDWTHGIFGDDQRRMLESFRQLLDEARGYGREMRYEALPSSFRKKMWAAFGQFTAAAMGSPLKALLARRGIAIERIGRSLLPTSNWFAYIDVLSAYLEQNYDMREGLGALDVPITVMIGMRSKMYPPAGQMEVARRAPRAQVVRFERSGHCPILDQPAMFTREFLRFMAS